MELTDFVIRSNQDLSGRVAVFADYVDLSFSDGKENKLVAEQIDVELIKISPRDGILERVGLDRYHSSDEIAKNVRFICSSANHATIKIHKTSYVVYYRTQIPG